MTNYEIMFILSTQLTDEEKKAYLKSMQDQMAQNEADQINT